MASISPDSHSHSYDSFKLPDAKTDAAAEVGEASEDEFSIDSDALTSIATKADNVASKSLVHSAEDSNEMPPALEQKPLISLATLAKSAENQVEESKEITAQRDENVVKQAEITEVSSSEDQAIASEASIVAQAGSEISNVLSAVDDHKNTAAVHEFKADQTEQQKTQTAQQLEAAKSKRAAAVGNFREAIKAGKIYLPSVVDGKVVLKQVPPHDIETMEKNRNNLIVVDGKKVHVSPEFAKKYPGLDEFSFQKADGTITPPKKMEVSVMTDEEMDQLDEAVKNHIDDIKAALQEEKEITQGGQEKEVGTHSLSTHRFELYPANKVRGEWNKVISMILDKLAMIDERTRELHSEERDKLAEEKKEFFMQKDLEKERVLEEKKQETLDAEQIQQSQINLGLGKEVFSKAALGSFTQHTVNQLLYGHTIRPVHVNREASAA